MLKRKLCNSFFFFFFANANIVIFWKRVKLSKSYCIPFYLLAMLGFMHFVADLTDVVLME